MPPVPTEEIVLPAAAFGSLCFVVFLVGLKLPVFQELPKVNRFFASCCLAALVNACTVSYSAVSSLLQMYSGPNAVSVDCGANGFIHAPAPAPALFACWLTLGYFVQDCVGMAVFPHEMKEGNGGATAYAIMWLHHIGSLITWPWGMLSDTLAPFNTYCLATEVTNIGQNLFMLANRGKVPLLKPVELPIGIVWMIAFFIVRILPVPYLLYSYVNTLILNGGCGMSTAEWVAGIVMVPIPVCLNIFWFNKIVNKAMRMLSGKSSGSSRKDT